MGVCIGGRCYFEVLAVREILTRVGMMTDHYFSFHHEDSIPEIKSRRLILCLSSELFLGWGKNIALIKRLLKRYQGEIVVLTPGRVPDTLFYHRRVRFICGDGAYLNISEMFSGEKNGPSRQPHRGRPWAFYGSVNACAAAVNLSPCTVYHHRGALVRSLAFPSLHHMRLCLTGCDERLVQDICAGLPAS